MIVKLWDIVIVEDASKVVKVSKYATTFSLDSTNTRKREFMRLTAKRTKNPHSWMRYVICVGMHR